MESEIPQVEETSSMPTNSPAPEVQEGERVVEKWSSLSTEQKKERRLLKKSRKEKKAARALEQKNKKKPEERNLLKKRVIDYIYENNYDQPYIQKWLKQPFMDQIRQDVNFWSFLNHNTLKKEFTESYSVFRQVRRMIKKLRELDTIHNRKSNLILFDIGSGKGYTSTLLSFNFPELQIKMVDIDRDMNVDHVKSLPNVEMVYMDINGKEFLTWMNKTLENSVGILMGTHLCGILSPRFINVYNTNENLKSMVLAPCCLSKRLRDLNETAKKLKIDNYMYWTMYLYQLVEHSRKDISNDDNVLSDKNNFICATKIEV